MPASAATPGMICSRPSVSVRLAGVVESPEHAATALTSESSHNDRDLMRGSGVRGESGQLVEPLSAERRHRDRGGRSRGSESLEFGELVKTETSNSSDSDPLDRWVSLKRYNTVAGGTRSGTGSS